MARKVLLICGILSSLLYVAINVFVPMQWEGYSSASQTVSELSAIGSPTRQLWLLLVIPYTLLMIAFGWGVWLSACRNRPLRVVGGLMIVHGVIGIFWPPMHLRGAEATLTDTLHIVFAIVTVLIFMLEVGFGAAAFGKRFRLYSIGTMVILFVFRRFGRIGWPPDRCQSADALGRGLGTHQHWRFPAVGSAAGSRSPSHPSRYVYGVHPHENGTLISQFARIIFSGSLGWF